MSADYYDPNFNNYAYGPGSRLDHCLQPCYPRYMLQVHAAVRPFWLIGLINLDYTVFKYHIWKTLLIYDYLIYSTFFVS